MYVCEGEPLAQYGSGETEKPEVDNDGTYLSFLEIGKELQYFSGFAVFSYPKFCAAHTPIAQHLRFNTRLCKTHKRRYNLPAFTDTRSAVPSLQPSPKQALLARTAVGIIPISQTLQPPNQKSPPSPSKQQHFPCDGCRLARTPSFSASAPPALR